MTSKPSMPPCRVMMRTAQMPDFVRRSSSASGVPGFTTATPLALLPSAFMDFNVTVLSSR